MGVIQQTIMAKCGIIVLAAGMSSRLGKPKQLLSYHGQSLLCHAAKTAMHIAPKTTIVVLGAERELMQRELRGLLLETVINQEYREGMASSIRCGLNYLIENHGDVEKVIFMVCDQPFVSSTHLLSLVDKSQRLEVDVVASFYAGKAGVPALFRRRIFPELMALEGDTGAKRIIERHSHDSAIVPLPLGHIDIDTPEAYHWLNKQQ